MFDRFTDRARKAMGYSRQEAQRFHHDYIGSEHILLGILREGGGGAVDALQGLGVDCEGVRRKVEKLMSHGATLVTMGQLPFTKPAKKALEFALEEASNLGCSYIGTEHLLLGVIREEGGIPARVLGAQVRGSDVRHRLLAREYPKQADSDRPEDPGNRPAPTTFFGSFSDRSRRVMGLARQEAQRFQHNYIGTDHMLLGLLAEDGRGVDVLKRLGVDPADARAETERRMALGREMVTMGQIPFTPVAKAALERTVEQCRALGHDRVRTEHLLLGLLLEEKGTAAQALAALGVTYEATRNEIAGPPAPPD